MITADAGFFGAALGACADVAASAPVVHAALPPPAAGAEEHPLYVETLGRARRYLDKSGQRLAITIVQASTLEQAAEALVAAGADAGPLGVVYIDADGIDTRRLEEQLEAFYARLAARTIPVVRSPYAVIVHRRTPPWSEGAHVLGDRCLERVSSPETPWLLRAEHLTALIDFVERTFEKPRQHKIAVRDMDTTLGDELVRFLSDRAGVDWTLYYYTGSSVSALIEHVERAASGRGVPVLRGANEHGLACGALAGHLLHGRPFLIVIGSAMMDEFRGTLANLRAAGAQGFIVCPEADLGSHYAFQGTITGDEDAREVLTARRLPHVYVDRTDRDARAARGGLPPL